MRLVTYTIDNLSNMIFPLKWAKKNQERILENRYSDYNIIPIIAYVGIEKKPYILSHFDSLGSLFLTKNANPFQMVACIEYDKISKENAIDMISTQHYSNEDKEAIRFEMNLLTSEEIESYTFPEAFNVNNHEFMLYINSRAGTGEYRRITEKALYRIYKSARLEQTFSSYPVDLKQQANILYDYLENWFEVIDKKEGSLTPTIARIGYLWHIFDGVFTLMVARKITMNSLEFKALLEEIFDSVIKEKTIYLVSDRMKATMISKLAALHSIEMRGLLANEFNPFSTS